MTLLKSSQLIIKLSRENDDRRIKDLNSPRVWLPMMTTITVSYLRLHSENSLKSRMLPRSIQKVNALNLFYMLKDMTSPRMFNRISRHAFRTSSWASVFNPSSDDWTKLLHLFKDPTTHHQTVQQQLKGIHGNGSVQEKSQELAIWQVQNYGLKSRKTQTLLSILFWKPRGVKFSGPHQTGGLDTLRKKKKKKKKMAKTLR